MSKMAKHNERKVWFYWNCSISLNFNQFHSMSFNFTQLHSHFIQISMKFHSNCVFCHAKIYFSFQKVQNMQSTVSKKYFTDFFSFFFYIHKQNVNNIKKKLYSFECNITLFSDYSLTII